MKTASGTYFNMYCEAGYKEYGVHNLDIFFLFHESLTYEECQKVFHELEEKTRAALEKWEATYGYCYTPDNHILSSIKEYIEEEFYETEWGSKETQGIVDLGIQTVIRRIH